MLKAISNGFRNPAYVPLHRFQLFAWKDGKRYPLYDFLAADPRTIAKVFKFAKEKNLDILHQGTFFLRKETARQLVQNRIEVYKEEKNRERAIEKIARLDLPTLSGPNKLVRLAYRVFIDVIEKDGRSLWRFVKYLWKLKIYPEVWETEDGYHIYIYFYFSKAYEEKKVKDKEGDIKVEKREKGYILAYARDYRIRDVELALERLSSKVGLKVGIISANKGVWIEGFSNSKLLIKGFPLPLEDLWRKLLNVWLPTIYRLSYTSNKPKDTEKSEEALKELDTLLISKGSDVFQALSQHGTLKACKKLWKAGYSLVEIEQELRKRLDIRTKSDEKALQEFLEYFYTHYTNIGKPKVWRREKKERKQEHYWEVAEKVKSALEEGYRKITHIARHLGYTRGKVKNFKSFLEKHGYSLEDLLTKPDEVIAFLKEHSKGGNKWRKKEWDKSAWIEEWQRKKEEYIKIRRQEAAMRREKKRAELFAEGKNPDRWRQAPVQILPANFSSF
ncbi:MAG: hypothetical protein JHC25_06085 [Thermodesulfobacterium sp.]|nr:hypothetical protein [Thermodesulfobacterium sp.]